MEIKKIYDELRSALQCEECGDMLKGITCESADVEKIVYLIRQIVTQDLIYEPKTIPFQFYADSWRKSPQMAKEIKAVLIEITSWNIAEINKGRIHDFLWIVEKRYDSAQEAVKIYVEYLNNSKNFENNFIVINRLFSIKMGVSQKKILNDEGEDILVKKVLEQSGVDDIAKRYYLLKTCYKYEVLHIAEILSLIEDEIDKFADDCKDIHLIEMYVNLFEKVYATVNNIEQRNLPKSDAKVIMVRRKKVSSLITAARVLNIDNPVGKLRYVQYMQNAVKILKLIPGTEEERKTILKDVEKVQQDAVLEFPVQTYSVDMTEVVNKIIKDVEYLDKEEMLCYLALFQPMISADNIRKQKLKEFEQNPISALFGAGILDTKGKKKAMFPRIFGDKHEINEDALLAYMEKEFQVIMNCDSRIKIANIKNLLQQKYDITVGDVEKIVEDSVFVPEGRKRAYLKGLMAGFENDFLTALSILIPQVENSVRYFAELCGEVLYNIKEDGTEELKSMNAILDLPNVRACFSEDLLFSLNSIFCSKYSLNMRNEVAHGTMNDELFDSYEALYTWWFVFKLCYMFNINLKCEYIQRVNDKIK